MRFLFTMMFLSLFNQAMAGTLYYMATDGNDTNDGLSSGTAWATFKKFADTASGGDDLEVAAGTYSGTTTNDNRLGYKDGASPGSSWSFPDGTAGDYTRVYAASPGDVIIENGEIYTGGAVTAGDSAGSNYIEIDGFKLKSSFGKIRASTYIYLRNTGFKNPHSQDDRYAEGLSIENGSSFILIEDVWMVGSYRYGIQVFESSKVILRRCVARHDGNEEREPKADFVFYGATTGVDPSDDCIAQNCISIDSHGTHNYQAGLSTAHQMHNGDYKSCIVINGPNNGTTLSDEDGARGNDLVNCVIWDCANGVALGNGDSTKTAIINTSTIGSNSERGVTEFGSPQQTINATFNMFLSNTSANDGTVTYDENFFNPAGHALGTNTYTTDPGLLHLPQTTQAGYGAEIIYRLGTTGAFYNDAGYDTLTTEKLWPFPNEARIHADFSEADGFTYNNDWNNDPIVQDSDRGFAAAGQTLTRYIWEYLGNGIPTHIYGEHTADIVGDIT